MYDGLKVKQSVSNSVVHVLIPPILEYGPNIEMMLQVMSTEAINSQTGKRHSPQPHAFPSQSSSRARHFAHGNSL